MAVGASVDCSDFFLLRPPRIVSVVVDLVSIDCVLCAYVCVAQCVFRSAITRRLLLERFGQFPSHGVRGVARLAFKAAGFTPMGTCALEQPRFANLLAGLDSWVTSAEDSLHTVRCLLSHGVTCSSVLRSSTS